MFGLYNFNVLIIILNIGYKEFIVGLIIVKVFIFIEYFFLKGVIDFGLFFVLMMWFFE